MLGGGDCKDVVQFLQTRSVSDEFITSGLKRLSMSPRSYLKCALLSFYFRCGVSFTIVIRNIQKSTWHQEEYHEEGDDVEAGIKAEG